MMLENVEKFAKKSNNTKITDAAQKAHDIMKSVVDFVNLYVTECSYIDTMKQIKKTVQDFNIDLYKYGNLLHEGDGKVSTKLVHWIQSENNN